MFKKRTRNPNLREKSSLSGQDTVPEVASGAGGVPDDRVDGDGQDVGVVDEEQPSETIQELLLLRSLSRSQSRLGIDLVRLNKGEERRKPKKTSTTGGASGGASKKKKRKAGDFGEGMEEGGEVGGLGGGSDGSSGEEEEIGDREGGDGYGLQGKGKKSGRDAMEEDAETDNNEQSKMNRLIRSNNFTQQTNALDVDKHMLAYIESELAKKRGGPSASSSSAGAGAGAKEEEYVDPQEELYKIAEKYRLEKKKGEEERDEEEGNVQTSMGMLTSIPEVDLGMDVRLKNIEQTERAKRAMMEQRKLNAGKRRDEADESFAAARFYRPTRTIQSDADALEDARREAANLPPVDRRSGRKKEELATDEMVYERFKKRTRKN